MGEGLAEDLKPHTAEGVYLNYISDEGEERVRSTYGPAKYDRLVALKDRYDPDNLFRLNQNIRPSKTGEDEVPGAAPATNAVVSLHREWAEFIDPRDASRWEIDLSFLASSWKCIYGCGCKGIHGEPVGGCCQAGVFVQVGEDDEEGAEDFKRVSRRVKELTKDDWDLVGRYRDDWYKERSAGSRHTRVSGGHCVFQNKGDGPSGTTGCAFHVAALRRGEDPLDWKPFTCGLVPFAIDHDEDEEPRRTPCAPTTTRTTGARATASRSTGGASTRRRRT